MFIFSKQLATINLPLNTCLNNIDSNENGKIVHSSISLFILFSGDLKTMQCIIFLMYTLQYDFYLFE